MSCSKCFQGHIHDEKTTGEVRNIFGRQTYVATPSDNAPIKGIAIIVPDAYGWEFINNRLLADHYASHGHLLVYLPDFMDGRSAPLWLLDVFARLGDANSIWDLMWKPSSRVLLGGRPVLTLTHSDFNTVDGKALVDAVFTGHPSGLALPDDAEKVTKPVAVAIGDKDQVTSMSQVNIMKNVWQRLGDIPTEVIVYPGAGHGFCVRVDPNNKNQFRQSKEAEEQALRWFDKHLG
ncbi:hypothetical protein FSARC_14715 [Fusarium sarcochroum]|uniref:Dienelactone hydrolase domain-containing protein n=1 Tax=Fusarium sarcochroum TaxID=1208366 RepID=A0A8H4WN96_9HYPO|nr:hypothetical protein FSARC_14715 [Fusarium sarcochroum]